MHHVMDFIGPRLMHKNRIITPKHTHTQNKEHDERKSEKEKNHIKTHATKAANIKTNKTIDWLNGWMTEWKCEMTNQNAHNVEHFFWI